MEKLATPVLDIIGKVSPHREPSITSRQKIVKALAEFLHVKEERIVWFSVREMRLLERLLRIISGGYCNYCNTRIMIVGVSFERNPPQGAKDLKIELISHRAATWCPKCDLIENLDPETSD